MEWLQKILANAVYGEDGKLDVDATMKKKNQRGGIKAYCPERAVQLKSEKSWIRQLRRSKI